METRATVPTSDGVPFAVERKQCNGRQTDKPFLKSLRAVNGPCSAGCGSLLPASWMVAQGRAACQRSRHVVSRCGVYTCTIVWARVVHGWKESVNVPYARLAALPYTLMSLWQCGRDRKTVGKRQGSLMIASRVHAFVNLVMLARAVT